MSEILIVVPPLVGHVNPTVALGAELERRGHGVTWAGLPGVVDRLLPDGARFVPVTGGMGEVELIDLQRRSTGLRGPAALKFLWEDFILPLARATAPEIVALVQRLEPDLIVVDQQAVAGAVAARLTGRTWVTSATTSAELTDPLAAMPKVDAWVRRQLVDLQIELGVAPEVAAAGDLRFSEHLVLAFTSPALAGDDIIAEVAPRVSFVGPSIGARPERVDFPWDWLRPEQPLVLVTLGTVNAEVGGRFFATAVEALAGEPLQAVLVAPPLLVDLPPGADNIFVAESVPQLALLASTDVVVCHGGHNTVCEALSLGIPLVVAPIRDDQPIVAEQVVRAGAGLRVRFGRVRADELRQVVGEALLSPDLRVGAAAVRRSFDDAGGAAAAAEAIEALQEVRV